MLKKYVFISYLILFLIPLANAQQHKSIRILVLDSQSNLPVPSATVKVSSYVGSTDTKGWIVFQDIPAGKHSLQVDAVGFVHYEDSINKFSTEILELTVPISEKSESIDGITVTAQTENQKIKQAPIRSVFIDTRAVATQATSLTDLMNRNTGIRIRQNGAVGSRPEISINGFQGKAIKYFKDGIPMDFLGNGYNLTSLPVEMLDHIEVYKGVLPVSLGADALGGAVNLVTDAKKTNQLKAYYEIGSFNSHRLGLIASKMSRDQKWNYGLEAYYNYADNDYKATVETVDPETKNLESRRLPMFHNAYKHLLAEAFVGIKNRSWADELKLSIIGFDLKKEQQHPALMTDAYGAVHAKQNSLVPSLRYKLNLLDNKIRIDQYTSYNNLQTQRIDTLKGSYDWLGNFRQRTTIGESRLPSESKINERQWITRNNISYQITPSSRLELNHVFTAVDRSGNDPLGPRLQGTDIDILTLESNYQKHVLGLALENNFLEDKLQNQLIVKYYNYKASGYQNTWFSTDITENDKRNVSGSYWGITEAFKYHISTNSLIRASAEYTYRLPDREELFGNNVFVVPNFELNPEKSLNFNLGAQTRFLERFLMEVNGFYRNTEGLILLVPIQAPNAQYQNQEHVKGFGFDVDLSYQLSKNYKLSGNATWQDLRLYGIENQTDAWKNEARLRNTPYFFANLAASANYKDLLSHNDDLSIFLNFNFMREFYLETIPKNLEPGGFLGLSGSANLNSNLIIPDQHLLNAGLSYGFLNKQVYVAAEIRNILNKDIYDYYRVQRPGRSFHLKLSYRF